MILLVDGDIFCSTNALSLACVTLLSTPELYPLTVGVVLKTLSTSSLLLGNSVQSLSM